MTSRSGPPPGLRHVAVGVAGTGGVVASDRRRVAGARCRARRETPASAPAHPPMAAAARWPRSAASTAVHAGPAPAAAARPRSAPIAPSTSLPSIRKSKFAALLRTDGSGASAGRPVSPGTVASPGAMPAVAEQVPAEVDGDDAEELAGRARGVAAGGSAGAASGAACKVPPGASPHSSGAPACGVGGCVRGGAAEPLAGGEVDEPRRRHGAHERAGLVDHLEVGHGAARPVSRAVRADDVDAHGRAGKIRDRRDAARRAGRTAGPGGDERGAEQHQVGEQRRHGHRIDDQTRAGRGT